MKLEWIEPLMDDIITYINEAKVSSLSIDELTQTILRIDSDMDEILSNGRDLEAALQYIFSDDSEMHILVLSALFHLYRKESFLDWAEDVVICGNLSYDMAVAVFRQSTIQRFYYGLQGMSYGKQRRIQEFLSNRLKSELHDTLEYIPYGQRNHNYIILSTNQLLSDAHAPTKLVLDVYCSLRYQWGYDVLLLVNVESDDSLVEYWVNHYVGNYRTDSKGAFSGVYKGKQIEGFQQIISEDHIDEVKALLERIIHEKPECIWYIGGMSVFSNLFSEITTLVAMPCTDGYAPSKAQVLVSYMRVNREMLEEERQYIRMCRQKTIDISFAFEYEKSGVAYRASDFDIPDEAFLIAVVGNRLDTEIDEVFIDVMEQIALIHESIYFVMIGEVKREFDQGVLQNRVVKLGFQKDLRDIIGICQLFLNPKRSGGGGGAFMAILEGVPVITLPDCDVANVGEDFICTSLDAYSDLVQRYYSDKEFYKKQVEACRFHAKRLSDVDNDAAFKQVISQTQRWLIEEEVS